MPMKPTDDVDFQRLTVIRGQEEQTRVSLAAEMPRMTFMEQEYRGLSIPEENNSSSGESFDPFGDEQVVEPIRIFNQSEPSTNENLQPITMQVNPSVSITDVSDDPNRILEAGDGSQLKIIGGVKYLKDRLQMEKEALLKVRDEQALAKSRNDQIVDEAVCKIDSVKTNIRGNLDQIRNLFRP